MTSYFDYIIDGLALSEKQKIHDYTLLNKVQHPHNHQQLKRSGSEEMRADLFYEPQSVYP